MSPVSVPLNAPPRATLTRLRRVTGIVVAPEPAFSTTAPLASPPVAGVVAVMDTGALAPGASVTVVGLTEPNAT